MQIPASIPRSLQTRAPSPKRSQIRSNRAGAHRQGDQRTCVGGLRQGSGGLYENDWLARTAINFGGIWANTTEEVLYYKGFADSNGESLHSDNTYTLTFPGDDLPARYARYFLSVIAVDSAHKCVLPNPLNRFLLNKESKLEYGTDGSLTLYFAPKQPAVAPEGNWLPTLGGQGYSLTFRFYGPRGGVADGTYHPPALQKVS